MANLNIPYIEMEFTFPETYPIEPPFIKIITPLFESLSDSITTDNHICIKLLDKTTWIPTTSVEEVITQIKLIFSDRNIFIRHICK
jgi:ubiquitin-conjugating enzyme E2 Q